MVKLSVVTPVYNGEEYIENCINAVIMQNCSRVEHIIVDALSDDSTVDIIKSYADKYPHIKYISEKDKGQSDAMNKGIAISTGEILSFLNVDDYYEPNVLNKAIEIFNELPHLSLLIGNCKVWDEEGRLKYINKSGRISFLKLVLGEQVHPVNPSCYFYDSSLHSLVGGYKVDNHYTMDLDFILRAVRVAHIEYVDEIWGNWCKVKGSKTFESDFQKVSEDRKRKLINMHLAKAGIIERSYISAYRLLGKVKNKFREIKA